MERHAEFHPRLVIPAHFSSASSCRAPASIGSRGVSDEIWLNLPRRIERMTHRIEVVRKPRCALVPCGHTGRTRGPRTLSGLLSSRASARRAAYSGVIVRGVAKRRVSHQPLRQEPVTEDAISNPGFLGPAGGRQLKCCHWCGCRKP